jgi:two-component system CheB/CheR fusion protein
MLGSIPADADSINAHQGNDGMMNTRRSPLLRFGMAVLTVVAASAIELVITSFAEHRTIVPLFMGAIMLTAWFGGLWPALLATALSVFSLEYFFFSPVSSTALGVDTFLQLATFTATAFGISALTSRMQRSQERERFLSDASHTLASSLDYQTTLRSVARLAVSHIADWCSVDMIEEDGSIRSLAVEHIDPKKVEWAHELRRRYPPDPDAPAGLPKVLRTGQLEFYPVITEAMLAAAVADEEQMRIARQVGYSSAMILPLMAHGRTLGAITLVSAESGHHYDRDDLELARHLARRAALAVENALLHREATIGRESLRITLASIGDAMIATDAEGNIVFMNPVAESLTGWSRAEALGMPLDEVFRIINEDTRQTVESPVTKVLREGKVVGLANHTLLIAKDGAEHMIGDSGAPIRDESGAITGVVLVFRDMGEEREAEERSRQLLSQLQLQRARMDAIVANVPGVVWEAWGEPDDRQQRIDFVSSYVEHMLGYSVQEWLATPNFWLTIIHPEDRERAAREAHEIYMSGRGGKSQFRWITRDGRALWVDAHSAVVLDEKGEPIGMRGVTMDITEQKLAELEVQRAKEEAEQANRSKDQFLAVLSHELRTPLTPVLTTIQLLQEDHLDPATRNLIDILDRNAQLEARLIDDLLDLTRITNGKLQLELATTDINLLIRDAIETTRSDIEGKDLHLTVELDAGEHHVVGDPARLQQVFWNLVKNAVKFTPDGGAIQVRSTNVDGRVRVEVIDTGIGIEPELLPRIFNAFEQGEQTITRRFGGLGLGLTISRMLIDMHGGELTASSEGKDRGACFAVELTTVGSGDAGAAGGGDRTPAVAEHRGVSILVVEDHLDTSRVMKLLLERHGYSVETADSVGAALEVASHRPFDLLISDISLPDGDGLELIRKLSVVRPVRGIALSGYGMEEDVRRSLAAGFTEHLTKPVNFKRLHEVIEQILG